MWSSRSNISESCSGTTQKTDLQPNEPYLQIKQTGPEYRTTDQHQSWSVGCNLKAVELNPHPYHGSWWRHKVTRRNTNCISRASLWGLAGTNLEQKSWKGLRMGKPVRRILTVSNMPEYLSWFRTTVWSKWSGIWRTDSESRTFCCSRE